MSKHHARLSGRRWTRTRRRVFERDGWRCQNCGKAGRLEAHHVQRLEDGGDPWDPDNILTYCRGCHIAEHRPDNMTPGRAAWLEFADELAGTSPCRP